jgi:hypothetical protein
MPFAADLVILGEEPLLLRLTDECHFAYALTSHYPETAGRRWTMTVEFVDADAHVVEVDLGRE